jgi:hypothetical protein
MKNRTVFPKRISIDLESFHVDGLEHLAGLRPHETQEDLLKVVISRGLVEMLRWEFERNQPSAKEVAHNLDTAKRRMQTLRSSAQRVDVRTSAPAPFGMKQSLDELHVQEAERDREMARMTRDLGLAETLGDEDGPNRPVGSHIGVPVPEDLRQGLESVLNAHPDLEEENLYTALLEVGLKGVLADPKALRPSKDAQKASLAVGTKEASRQQLRAEWRLLCRNVARGWR